MESIPINTEDKDINKALNHIFANAIGNVIIRNEAPTSADMKANTLAFYNNEMYCRLSNGILYKFTLTPV